MKALLIFLLLAVCLLTAEILLPALNIPIDENGIPVLLDDNEDESCFFPAGEDEPQIGEVSPKLA